MDDAAVPQNGQRVQDLLAEQAHQVHRQAPELVLLDQLEPAQGAQRVSACNGLLQKSPCCLECKITSASLRKEGLPIGNQSCAAIQRAFVSQTVPVCQLELTKPPQSILALMSTFWCSIQPTVNERSGNEWSTHNDFLTPTSRTK